MESESAPGFRFHPTDKDLITYYLNRKKLGYDDQVAAIGEIDICKFEPWQLPQLAAMQTNDCTWYFFTRPDYKYRNSKRANRMTNSGYWKVTCKDKKIVDGNNNQIGTKKTLVFYEGHVPNGVKTNWVIHEFHSSINYSDQRDFVLSRLRQKSDGNTDHSMYEEGQPSRHVTPQMEPQFQEIMENSPSTFDDQDFGYSSPTELGLYMWQDGPSYGSYIYSSGC